MLHNPHGNPEYRASIATGLRLVALAPWERAAHTLRPRGISRHSRQVRADVPHHSAGYLRVYLQSEARMDTGNVSTAPIP